MCIVILDCSPLKWEHTLVLGIHSVLLQFLIRSIVLVILVTGILNRSIYYEKGFSMLSACHLDAMPSISPLYAPWSRLLIGRYGRCCVATLVIGKLAISPMNN